MQSLSLQQFVRMNSCQRWHDCIMPSNYTMLQVVMNEWLDPKLARMSSIPKPLAVKHSPDKHQSKQHKSQLSFSNPSEDVLSKAAAPAAAPQRLLDKAAQESSESAELLAFHEQPTRSCSVRNDGLAGHQLPFPLDTFPPLEFSENAADAPVAELLSWLDEAGL